MTTSLYHTKRTAFHLLAWSVTFRSISAFGNYAIMSTLTPPETSTHQLCTTLRTDSMQTDVNHEVAIGTPDANRQIINKFANLKNGDSRQRKQTLRELDSSRGCEQARYPDYVLWDWAPN